MVDTNTYTVIYTFKKDKNRVRLPPRKLVYLRRNLLTKILSSIIFLKVKAISM